MGASAGASGSTRSRLRSRRRRIAGGLSVCRPSLQVRDLAAAREVAKRSSLLGLDGRCLHPVQMDAADEIYVLVYGQAELIRAVYDGSRTTRGYTAAAGSGAASPSRLLVGVAGLQWRTTRACASPAGPGTVPTTLGRRLATEVLHPGLLRASEPSFCSDASRRVQVEHDGLGHVRFLRAGRVQWDRCRFLAELQSA